jgi:hypothetical protein
MVPFNTEWSIVRDIGHQSPDATPGLFLTLFAAFDGINLMIFGGLVFAAIRARRYPDRHKRCMVLATVCLLPPTLGRIAIRFVTDDSEPITKLILLGSCVSIAVVITR